MVWIRKKASWEIDESRVTPHEKIRTRRQFLRTVGAAGAYGLLQGGLGCSFPLGAQSFDPEVKRTLPPKSDAFRPTPNPAYNVAERAVTREEVAASYNNYYEFTTEKERVWRLAEKFKTRPWQVEVAGLVKKPKTYDLDDLLKEMPLEERIYRMRCVEAWSMVVPWAGFPLRKLLEKVEPTSKARFVRLVTFLEPEQAVGQRSQPWYDWPYYEGLRLDEAMHELTLIATGLHGRPLPNQNGAPLRLVVPWKYGFKSIKGIVRIELVAEQPKTFWNDLAPHEYDFLANVDPGVPHPRWSQATERDIGTGERIPTLPFNGYGEQVAALYR